MSVCQLTAARPRPIRKNLPPSSSLLPLLHINPLPNTPALPTISHHTLYLVHNTDCNRFPLWSVHGSNTDSVAEAANRGGGERSGTRPSLQRTRW
ncbi:hypothetical protein PBY51_009174 [Eleginops maclovinus]|uniref:Uncharacterized protein n=1 Tax=Eleginops maclovinus TaxID=56733 RepID=A0AAN8AUV8_ELEMC|nr:hypothetical protein PBY51_009174 [Eleginops maclovinus]